MSVVIEILTELHARGVRIELCPHGGVRLTPARLIDPALLSRIQAHKSELLAYLHTAREDAQIDRLAAADGWKPLPPAEHPAYSIVENCRHSQLC